MFLGNFVRACVCWKLSLGSLEEQQVLVAISPAPASMFTQQLN